MDRWFLDMCRLIFIMFGVFTTRTQKYVDSFFFFFLTILEIYVSFVWWINKYIFSVFQMCSIELITIFTRIVLTMNIWKETNAKVLIRKWESQRIIHIYDLFDIRYIVIFKVCPAGYFFQLLKRLIFICSDMLSYVVQEHVEFLRCCVLSIWSIAKTYTDYNKASFFRFFFKYASY